MNSKFISILLTLGLLAGLPGFALASHNNDPTVHLTIDEEAGDYWTLFWLNASNSYDEETDFHLLRWRWDFDYTGSKDDTYDTDWSTGSTVYRYFDEEPGDITIRVEVKDEDGNIEEDFVEIYIHWASEYMKQLRDRHIMTGYDNTGGDMGADNDITRGELVKMALLATGFNRYESFKHMGYFPDVWGGDWHYYYVESAYEMGLVSGYDDGLFRPNEAITRAEAVKIIVEAFDLNLHNYKEDRFRDVDSSDWYSDYIETAYDHDLVDGYSSGYFRPNQSITRGEVAKIVALAMDNT